MVEISVLIPSYNVEKYIRECLDSIANQTFEDMEIICIDDGSTDSILDILNKYALKDSRIRVYENNANKGVAYTRNYLLSLAKGQYVSFIDADDYLELDASEKLHNLAEEKSLEMLMFKIRHFNDLTKKNLNSITARCIIWRDSLETMSSLLRMLRNLLLKCVSLCMENCLEET